MPLTDPESRVTPNKEGGFAPNYTPWATVDVASGLIVSVDVIPHTAEDKHLIAAIEDVQQQFGWESPPRMLADGMLASGDNLAACAERGIDLYSPVKGQVAENPALRADPTQPVPAADRDKLPTQTIKRNGVTIKQLEKQAFVYDQGRDCYWCPEGKPLRYQNTTREKRGSTERIRRRYLSSAQDCAACPLAALCLQGQVKRRSVNREQHEAHREAHAKKMATPAAKDIYVQRRHPGERPFAVIKHQFGARHFLLRGLKKVQQEGWPVP